MNTEQPPNWTAITDVGVLAAQSVSDETGHEIVHRVLGVARAELIAAVGRPGAVFFLRQLADRIQAEQ
ncbi:MAG: hypothetical protein E2O54_07665 [Gammaproteobacteria bacterium]|nr:MAG: hypothetical protein E2O54_07665 [Gammaproteobacteria bacterium]